MLLPCLEPAVISFNVLLFHRGTTIYSESQGSIYPNVTGLHYLFLVKQIENQCLKVVFPHLLQCKEKGISKICVLYILSLKQEKAKQSNTDISFLQKKVEESFSASYFSLAISHLFTRIKTKSVGFFSHRDGKEKRKKNSENEVGKESIPFPLVD